MSDDTSKFSGRRVLLASVGACLLGAALAGVAAAGVTTERKVGLNEIVEVRSDLPCLWDARSPLTLDLRQYAVVDANEAEQDIDYVALFWSGSTPRTIVIDAWRNGPVIPDKDRHIIVVGDGGNPDPPDPPDPPDNWPPTTFDVGPELAYVFKHNEQIAQAFEQAAGQMRMNRNGSLIRSELNSKLLKQIDAAQYASYYKLMKQRFDDGRIRTVTQHAQAYDEIVAWLRKAN